MSLQPVIVALCAKCGLPPEYCAYNLEVDHGPAPAAVTSTAAVESKLGDLAVGARPAEGAEAGAEAVDGRAHV